LSGVMRRWVGCCFSLPLALLSALVTLCTLDSAALVFFASHAWAACIRIYCVAAYLLLKLLLLAAAEQKTAVE